MRRLILLLCISIIFSSEVNSQTWQSISKTGTFETAPFRQFIIDPYTNSIWLIHDTKVSVIENDGSISIFTDAELGTLWTNDNIHFAFTPTDIYYGVDLYGLFTFTGYLSTSVDSNISDFIDMSSNSDTIYVTRGFPDGFVKHNAGSSQVIYKYYSKINAKNNFFYGHDGSSLIYQYDQSTNTQVNLTTDPQYLYCLFNDVKFSRKTDTLFVGSINGISYAYNYDFLDTITPNNSFNMPSANVLEIEFDHLDSLWAVFGDINGAPFAIAKLEGDTWTNIFNSSNSPIDFSNYLGLEIDTLGNLWVADNQYLHTLLTPNSPDWLGVNEFNLEQEIFVYPNPGSETISLQNLMDFDVIKIIDLQGRVVFESQEKVNIDVSSFHRGNYIIQVFNNQKMQNLQFIKD